MPKRKNDEKIERYKRKIRKIEQRERLRAYKKRNRISEESDNNCSDHEQQTENHQKSLETLEPECENKTDGGQEPIPVVPELDPDIITALGEANEDTPSFGPKIHENLSRLWLPILRKGMDKVAKENLIKDYAIPENCALLQAPKLNPEILAAVSDSTRARDKRVEALQQQLGLGITALNKGLELLLENKDRLQAIKFLSDSCRLLFDLHHVESEARKKFVTPGLDKSFLNIMQDVNRDEMLFGSQLSEKIKVTKVIEKHGLQIKKPTVNPKPQNQQLPSTSRPHPQGNWTSPSRFSSNRGGGEGPGRPSR